MKKKEKSNPVAIIGLSGLLLIFVCVIYAIDGFNQAIKIVELLLSDFWFGLFFLGLFMFVIALKELVVNE